MRSLIPNSLLNVGAFGVNAAAQLAIVPLIVGYYGLAALGLLALVRLLTPVGALGLFCPGLQTSAVRLAARKGGEVERAALLLALATGLLIGLIIAVVFAAVDPRALLTWVGAPAEYSNRFVRFLGLLAIAQPILFVGLVAQGVLTGYRRFGLLRIADVLVTLGFLTIVFLGGSADVGIVWLLGAYICLHSIKALWFIAASCWQIVARGKIGWKLDWWRAVTALRKELRTLVFSDLIAGAAAQAPSAIIVVAGGAELLGLYDGLRRVPMALKQLAGAARTAILPVAIEIDTSKAYRRALALRGSFITALCLVPFGVHLAVFSEDLLVLWLGEEFAVHAWTFSVFMLELLAVQIHGVMMAASAANLGLVRRETLVRALQLVAILAVLPWAVERGNLLPAALVLLAVAIAGRTAAAIFYLPFFGIAPRDWIVSQSRMLVIPALLGLAVASLAVSVSPALRLFLVMPASLTLSLAVILLLIQGEERVALRQTYADAIALGKNPWRLR